MSDTVRIVLEQVDESTEKPISKLVVEWYGNDRNIANALSMEVVQGVVDRVSGLSATKAEVTGTDDVKAMLQAAKNVTPPGAIR